MDAIGGAGAGAGAGGSRGCPDPGPAALDSPALIVVGRERPSARAAALAGSGAPGNRA
jgi:hypothetical protein